MALFSDPSTNLFAVLASKNRERYGLAVVVLHELFMESPTIRKKDYIARLRARVEARFASTELEEDRIADDLLGIKDEDGVASDAASTIYRRLKAGGWFLEEAAQTTSGVATIMLIPSEAQSLAKFIAESYMRSSESSACMFVMHSALKGAAEEATIRMGPRLEGHIREQMADVFYDAFQTAKEKTSELMSKLHGTEHDLKITRGKITAVSSVEEMQELTQEYLREYVDKIMFPLKIEDSYAKYKLGCIGVLAEWAADDEIKTLLAESAKKRRGISREPSLRDIEYEINDLIYDIQTRIDRAQQSLDETRNGCELAYLRKWRALMEGEEDIGSKLLVMLSRMSASNEGVFRDAAFESGQSALDRSAGQYFLPASLDGRFKSRNRAKPTGERAQVRPVTEITPTASDVFGEKDVSAAIRKYRAIVERHDGVVATPEIDIATVDDVFDFAMALCANSSSDPGFTVHIADKNLRVRKNDFYLPMASFSDI